MECREFCQACWWLSECLRCVSESCAHAHKSSVIHPESVVPIFCKQGSPLNHSSFWWKIKWFFLSIDALLFKRRKTFMKTFNYSSHAFWPGGHPGWAESGYLDLGSFTPGKCLPPISFSVSELFFSAHIQGFFPAKCHHMKNDDLLHLSDSSRSNSMKQIKKCQVKRNLFVSLAWQKKW